MTYSSEDCQKQHSRSAPSQSASQNPFVLQSYESAAGSFDGNAGNFYHAQASGEGFPTTCGGSARMGSFSTDAELTIGGGADLDGVYGDHVGPFIMGSQRSLAHQGSMSSLTSINSSSVASFYESEKGGFEPPLGFSAGGPAGMRHMPSLSPQQAPMEQPFFNHSEPHFLQHPLAQNPSAARSQPQLPFAASFNHDSTAAQHQHPNYPPGASSFPQQYQQQPIPIAQHPYITEHTQTSGLTDVSSIAQSSVDGFRSSVELHRYAPTDDSSIGETSQSEFSLPSKAESMHAMLVAPTASDAPQIIAVPTSLRAVPPAQVLARTHAPVPTQAVGPPPGQRPSSDEITVQL